MRPDSLDPARGATAKPLPNGTYAVSFTVEGKKLYADGKGKETEAPLDEPFDVGAFTEEPAGRIARAPENAACLARPK